MPPPSVGVVKSPEDVRSVRSCDLVARWAAEDRDRLGLGCDGRWITFGEWHARVVDRAAGLREGGVSPVALAYDAVDGVEFGVSYVASHLAGRPAVVLNPRLPARGLQRQIDWAGAGTVLSGGRDELTPAAVSRSTPLLDQWGETVAEISFSSGTTGEPKGIVLSHWALAWAGVLGSDLLYAGRYSYDAPGEPLGPGDTIVSAFQAGSAMTTNGFLNSGLAAGARMHFLSKFDAGAFSGFMREVGGTVFFCAPVHLALWRQAEPDATPTARMYMLGGQEIARVDVDWLLERRGDAHLINCYASTESCAGLLFALDDEVARDAGAFGRPLDGYAEVRLVDADGEETDHEGQLTMRCFGMMEGYLDRPDLTAEKLRDGWLYMGDIVERRDGIYFMRGRMGDRINRGGYKFDPIEIEEIAARVAGVTGAVACSIPHPTLGEDVALAIEVAVGHNSDQVRDEVASTLARELPSFKVPRDIRDVREMPRAALGKPQRATIAQWFIQPDDGPG
jgi:acyl-CoA synthetase (AMP-forming)/AMP-acid ligase II